jgi:hypothetical protein
MLIFSIVAAALGAALGLRFRISVLVPAIFVAATIVAISGIVLGDSARTIALTTFLVATSLQVGYLTGCVLRVIFALARAGNGAGVVLRGGRASLMRSEAGCRDPFSEVLVGAEPDSRPTRIG